MKTSRFTESQIKATLKQADVGMPVTVVSKCRNCGLFRS